jgi:hypothetical protein
MPPREAVADHAPLETTKLTDILQVRRIFRSHGEASKGGTVEITDVPRVSVEAVWDADLEASPYPEDAMDFLPEAVEVEHVLEDSPCTDVAHARIDEGPRNYVQIPDDIHTWTWHDVNVGIVRHRLPTASKVDSGVEECRTIAGFWVVTRHAATSTQAGIRWPHSTLTKVL